MLLQLGLVFQVLLQAAAKRAFVIDPGALLAVANKVFIFERLLAELADEKDLVKEVHDDAVDSVGDLEDGLAVGAGSLMVIPALDARRAVKLLATSHLGDGRAKHIQADGALQGIVERLVLGHILGQL